MSDNKGKGRIVAQIIVAVIIALLVGCAAQLQPAPAGYPTEAPVAEPTVAQAIPATMPPRPRMFFEDDFSTDKGWSTWRDDTYWMERVEDQYRLGVGKGAFIVGGPRPETVGDFDLKVNVRLDYSSDYAAAGVIFRADPGDFWKQYRFGINNQGGFEFLHSAREGHILDGQNVAYPSDWNTLEVRASGSRFDFYINGNLVGSTEEWTSASGTWGLYFYAANSGQASFDDVGLVGS